jgi:hypothetical protein
MAGFQTSTEAPHVHERRPLQRDVVRATLVSYVHRTTAQFHDDEVAALISVVESEGDGDPFLAVAGARQTDYTTEAHVQWRSRQSCRELLDGPSQAVQELEAAMEQELRQG